MFHEILFGKKIIKWKQLKCSSVAEWKIKYGIAINGIPHNR